LVPDTDFLPATVSRRGFLKAAAAAGLSGGIESFQARQNQDPALIGYWPLKGDCRDYSAYGHHGVNHGVDLTTGEFEGQDHIVVAHSPALDPGAGSFSVSAWIHTVEKLEDVVGDVLGKFDASSRQGFTLIVKASSGGYNSQGTDKHVYFGIDNGRTSDWQDCGRPSPTSNYVSNSLTVFDNHLYAGTTDGATEQDWCHVYRFAGGERWEDCGRVGNLRTRGVGPMIVHDGHLYAATWSYDWRRVSTDNLDNCRVYRYQGGRVWEDCGQPGQCRRLFSLASFKGALYVIGDDNQCHVYQGGKSWKACGKFPDLVHPMAVHDGRLYAGAFGAFVEGGLRRAAVYEYDGEAWRSLGNPLESTEPCDQIHALEVYRGNLYATTWPTGKVALYQPAGKWVDCGRLGDSTEINALTVYNGKLYAGSIPRAEVYRYEGGRQWTRLKRFFEPPGWEPIPVVHDRSQPDARKRTGEWTRVTSLTVFDGKLFASIGSCTSSLQDAPADVRGKVFAMRAGECASYDRDLGSGWKHLVAIRNLKRLELYLNGELKKVSSEFEPGQYDLANSEPLKIGGGELDSFSGRIREVRFYRRALEGGEVARLYKNDLRFFGSGR
jgi:hypothetical protein